MEREEERGEMLSLPGHRKPTAIRLFFLFFLFFYFYNQLGLGPLEHHLRQRKKTGITEAQGGREEIDQLRVRGAKGIGWETSNLMKERVWVVHVKQMESRPFPICLSPSILIACPPFLLIRFLHILPPLPTPFASLSPY